MATLNEMIVEYNGLADKPLKSWKGSKEALQARIDALAPRHDVKSAVVHYCNVHGVNAKTARAALRRAGYNAPYKLDAALCAVIDSITPRSHTGA